MLYEPKWTEHHQFYWHRRTMEKVASTILVADHYKCPAILCQYLLWVDLFYCLDFWLSMQDLRYILRLFDFISDWPYRHGLKDNVLIQGLLEIWAEHSKKLQEIKCGFLDVGKFQVTPSLTDSLFLNFEKEILHLSKALWNHGKFRVFCPFL